MHREIVPGIHWLYEAGPDRTERFDLAARRPDWYEPGREAYIPQCAYLVDGSEASEAIHEAIDHPRSRVETTVERVLLSELGGGCVAPIGIYAVVQGEHVRARVQVLSADGEEAITASRDLPVRTYAEAAREFADDLAERGATELIEAATEDVEAEAGPRTEPDEG